MKTGSLLRLLIVISLLPSMSTLAGASENNDSRWEIDPLNSNQVVITEIDVSKRHPYEFVLAYGFHKDNAQEYQKVRGLAGDFGRNRTTGNIASPGTSIPVQLTIQLVSGSEHPVIFEQIITQEERFASGYRDDGTAVFYKKIAGVWLDGGSFFTKKYRVTLRVLKPAPDLQGTPVFFGYIVRVAK